MNLIYKTTLVLLLAVFFLSCQNEEVVINNPEENTLSTASTLAGLVAQVTLNDGSEDNIIDNSSCVSIVLPVTVIVNGQELVISTEDDYKLIERVFDESADDVDELVIIFPIKVVLPDFSELELNNYDELEDLVEDCLEGGDDLDIECLDFKYPINISVYDSASQTTNVVEISNDQDLYEFLSSAEDYLLFTINYPVTLILSDSSELEVNSNLELELIIDEVEDSCDEDDDSDYSDDDIDNTEFNMTLLNSAWLVTYHFDEEDLTQEFMDMIFVFKPEEVVQVFTDLAIYEGEWDSYGDDGTIELEFDFSDFPLEYLDKDDWEVGYYDSTIIELSYLKDDNSLAYLTLEATEYPDTTISAIGDYLIDVDWEITLFENSEIDNTGNYVGYAFDFQTNMSLLFANDTDSFEGSWEESTSGDHTLLININSENASIKELNKNWHVKSHSETKIELEFEDEVQELTYRMILEPK